MVYSVTDRIANAKTKYETWIDAFGFNIRHVRRDVSTTSGGSPAGFTVSINELLPSAGPFVSTTDAENIVDDLGDMTEGISAHRKFYVKGAADIRVHDEVFIKKSGGAWTDPADSLDDYTYRFRIDSVEEQSGGRTIAGAVFYATLLMDDVMDDYFGLV